jgi:hypothetical protein
MEVPDLSRDISDIGTSKRREKEEYMLMGKYTQILCVHHVVSSKDLI